MWPLHGDIENIAIIRMKKIRQNSLLANLQTGWATLVTWKVVTAQDDSETYDVDCGQKVVIIRRLYADMILVLIFLTRYGCVVAWLSDISWRLQRVITGWLGILSTSEKFYGEA